MCIPAASALKDTGFARVRRGQNGGTGTGSFSRRMIFTVEARSTLKLENTVSGSSIAPSFLSGGVFPVDREMIDQTRNSIPGGSSQADPRTGDAPMASIGSGRKK
jgi:hypothetical protein